MTASWRQFTIMRPMRRISLLIFCFLFPFFTGASLADPTNALAQLEKAPFFPFGGVGIVGSRAPSDALFLELARDANNAALFHSLWNDGNNEAKCYAVLGLYWLKDSDADRFAQHLTFWHVSISTARGCMVGSKEEVASFIDSLKSGQHLRYYFPELAAAH
jgi:hypothetical protein